MSTDAGAAENAMNLERAMRVYQELAPEPRGFWRSGAFADGRSITLSFDRVGADGYGAWTLVLSDASCSADTREGVGRIAALIVDDSGSEGAEDLAFQIEDTLLTQAGAISFLLDRLKDHFGSEVIKDAVRGLEEFSSRIASVVSSYVPTSERDKAPSAGRSRDGRQSGRFSLPRLSVVPLGLTCSAEKGQDGEGR